ncbi:aldo/keto reductase [Thermogymnomonas acidicola]|nr:aldo/keto reductase [Thermogymnomonas acidicola]
MRDFSGTGFMVSEIGVGTYYDPGWIVRARLFGSRPNRDMKVKAISTALECGVNMIDTAEIYQSEDMVAEALGGRDRSKVFLATKVWPSHYRRERLLKSLRASLRRLGTDYVDLYQLHLNSSREKVGEALKAIEEQVKEGTVRYIGISNFDAELTKFALSVVRDARIVSTQMPFNLLNRKIEADILPICRENGMSVLAYYPLGHGRLVTSSGKFAEAVKKIQEDHPGKTVPQIVLNWFLSKFDNVYPIPRASNPEHVRENTGAMGWKMDEEEIKMLEQSVS